MGDNVKIRKTEGEILPSVADSNDVIIGATASGVIKGRDSKGEYEIYTSRSTLNVSLYKHHITITGPTLSAMFDVYSADSTPITSLEILCNKHSNCPFAATGRLSIFSTGGDSYYFIGSVKPTRELSLIVTYAYSNTDIMYGNKVVYDNMDLEMYDSVAEVL